MLVLCKYKYRMDVRFDRFLGEPYQGEEAEVKGHYGSIGVNIVKYCKHLVCG